MPPRLPRVYSNSYSSSESYYDNVSVGYLNGIINAAFNFKSPGTEGHGSFVIIDPPLYYNNTTDSGSSILNYSNGFISGSIPNGTTNNSYAMSISGNNLTLNTSSDPSTIALDPELKYGIINNAVYFLVEEKANLGDVGEGAAVLSVLVMGALAFFLFTTAVSISTTVGVSTAGSIAYAAGTGISVSLDSVSAGLGGITVAIAGVADALTTNDLLQNSNGGLYTMYAEVGFDLRFNVPWWDLYWAWPPLVGFYGEVGAYVGFGGSYGVYIPAMVTQWNADNRHTTVMPSVAPPWWW